MASSSSSYQRAIKRRKYFYYPAAILALFTLSILWRGKVPVPLSRSSEVAQALTSASIQGQAERKELRELDQGDADVLGTALRLTLFGSRGVAITALWTGAIQKQRRNEFHEFELLVRTVTKLQPNFITPWIFQSWNIAYNVSVEHDKLGDMYFYIARGIELLRDGDKVNTKKTVIDDKVRELGSPDIRHQIGFYYQNKFSVSDKVSTLRSLMQLSCIKPADRRASALEIPGQGVNAVAFRRFCEENPQLVRRLRNKLDCQRPEQVVQFLADNEKVPTLYKNDNELASVDDRFPTLPKHFDESPDEYNPDSPMDDTFNAFHAARAWFAYGLPIVPPGKVDAGGEPLPWTAPAPGEYDQRRYRMPRAPALIIYKQAAPRAQTYLADQLTKEGWFDAATAWSPDERASAETAWLGSPGEGRALKTKSSAQEQWQKAAQLWSRHGEENAMTISDARRAVLQERSGLRGAPAQLPPEDMSPEELAARGLTRERVEAIKALVYLDQNRSMTNFDFFLNQAKAEGDPVTVQARKALAEAESAKAVGSDLLAAERYRTALAYWRQALIQFPDFHRPQAGGQTATEESTYEYELALTDLLRFSGPTRERAKALASTMASVLGPVSYAAEEDLRQATAEDEALTQIALESILSDARYLKPQPGDPRADARAEIEKLAAGKPAAERDAIARGVLNSPKYSWMKEFKYEVQKSGAGIDPRAYWVSPEVREATRERMGRVRRTVQPEAPPGDPAAPAAAEVMPR